jgi:hypothetical protein
MDRYDAPLSLAFDALGVNGLSHQVDLIVDVAKRVCADAVWPGWGHASENPALPDALDKHNITFLVGHHSPDSNPSAMPSPLYTPFIHTPLFCCPYSPCNLRISRLASLPLSQSPSVDARREISIWHDSFLLLFLRAPPRGPWNWSATRSAPICSHNLWV